MRMYQKVAAGMIRATAEPYGTTNMNGMNTVAPKAPAPTVAPSISAPKPALKPPVPAKVPSPVNAQRFVAPPPAPPVAALGKPPVISPKPAGGSGNQPNPWSPEAVAATRKQLESLAPRGFKPLSRQQAAMLVTNALRDREYQQQLSTSIHMPTIRVKQQQPLPIPNDPAYQEFSNALQSPELQHMRVGETTGSMLQPGTQEALRYFSENGGGGKSQAEVAKNYILDTAKQRAAATRADNYGEGWLDALGRESGSRRQDSNGNWIQTTDNNIGKQRDGLYGAAKATLSSIPYGIAGLVTSPAAALAGDFSQQAAAYRDFLAVLNHLGNTDFGHDIKPDAAMRSLWDVQDPTLRDAFTGQSTNRSTPGLVGSTYQPPTKPGQEGTFTTPIVEGIGSQLNYNANDKTNDYNELDRIGAKTLATMFNNAGDAGAAVTGARAVGPLLRTLGLTGEVAAVPGASKVVQGLIPRVVQTAKNIPGNVVNTVKTAPVNLLKSTAKPVGAGAAIGAGTTMVDPGAGDTFGARANSAVRTALEAGAALWEATPANAFLGAASDVAGIPDKATAAANWIRGNYGTPEASPSQQALANTVASTLETGANFLPMLFTGRRGTPTKLRDLVKNPFNMPTATGAVTSGALSTAYGAADAAATALNSTDASTGERQANLDYARDTPIEQQNQDTLAAQLQGMAQYREDHGLSENEALTQAIANQQPQQADSASDLASVSPQAVPEAAATFQPGELNNPLNMRKPDPPSRANVAFQTGKISPKEILSPEQSSAVSDFGTKHVGRAIAAIEAEGKVLSNKVNTPASAEQLKTLQATGELTPEAKEATQFNLMQDGFDPDKIKGWYGQLGTAEKFALWGGVSMTMLGLIQAMNEGGVGAWLTALLGIGTVGLTAGQSGLFGDTSQQMSQKVTKPVGNAVSSGVDAIVGKVMQSPGAMKALVPLMDKMPDSVISTLQDQLRKYKPDIAAKLDSVTAPSGFIDTLGSMTGASMTEAKRQLTNDFGFSPELADRWMTQWAQPRQSSTVQ